MLSALEEDLELDLLFSELSVEDALQPEFEQLLVCLKRLRRGDSFLGEHRGAVLAMSELVHAGGLSNFAPREIYLIMTVLWTLPSTLKYPSRHGSLLGWSHNIHQSCPAFQTALPTQNQLNALELRQNLNLFRGAIVIFVALFASMNFIFSRR